MPPLITSSANAHIKTVRALARRKERDATGRCVAEGIFHVGEALDAAVAGRARVEYLLVAPDLLISPFGRGLAARAASEGVPVHETTADVLAGVAAKDNPQGLLAVVQPRRSRLDDLYARDAPWLVAAVAPQDPGNVGTILRTIDAVGASGLLLLDGGVDALHPAAVRASMGAVFHRPVVSASFADFLRWARAGGYRLIATSAHGQADYRHVGRYAPPLVLLLGSEREGLTTAQVAACDELVRLPMHGRATSLNLAVAAGVMLYAIHDSLDAQSLLPD